MKQSIQLKMGQSLTMTPQLQQAIRLLQLSTLELQTEIQSALESNLMLEAEEQTDDKTEGLEAVKEKELKAEATAEAPQEAASTEITEEQLTKQELPEDLPIDSVWEDVYDGSTSYSKSSDSDKDYLEPHQNHNESLTEHLVWQLEMSDMNDQEKQIGLMIVDSINDDGYLDVTLDDILNTLPADITTNLDQIESVLYRVQCFDPVGVASRDLSECIVAQLRQLPGSTPFLGKAIEITQSHLGSLANREFPQLMRQLKITEDELKNIIRLIQSINPRPGSQITDKEPEYIVPDVFVKKVKGRWQVELNPDTLPKIRINTQYAGMIKRADSSNDNVYLKNHLQEARWFLKSLQSRNETLLKVATCIVDRQRAFLEYGEESMKPLVLRDVAETVEMHESTVSRVTTQKYMHTPMGIFEFKYFFSSHVGTADGGECSATAIRAIIKKFLAAENPGKPLSDSKIAELLMKQGIKVARRTVAKYRESMMIPPSNERKRLSNV